MTMNDWRGYRWVPTYFVSYDGTIDWQVPQDAPIGDPLRGPWYQLPYTQDEITHGLHRNRTFAWARLGRLRECAG